MRITYLHQYFNTPDMSGSTRSYEFAKRLVAKGHEVNMITSWREETKKHNLIENIDGINVHWIAVPYNNKMGFVKRLKAFFSFALKSAKLASSLSSDVIFASSTPLTIALPAIWASKRKKIPMVFEVRDLWPEAAITIGALKNPVLIFAAKMLEKFAYKNSTKIIALAPRIANGIINADYNEKNIAIISNGCDIEFFNPKNAASNWFAGKIPNEEKVIIATYAGTIGKVNNISYLVEIAKYCLTILPEINFAIIGEGAERQKTFELAKEKKVLDNNFFMFPSVKKNEIPNVLASSTITFSLVQNNPKLSGDSANKFFDSLAAAKPICINHGGWLADFIKEYNVGLVLPANDAKKAASFLRDWCNKPEKVKKEGNNALVLAQSHFDRDKLADKLEIILIDAVNTIKDK